MTHLVTVFRSSKRVTKPLALGDTVRSGQDIRSVRRSLQEPLTMGLGYTCRVTPSIGQGQSSLLGKVGGRWLDISTDHLEGRKLTMLYSSP